MPAIEGIAIHVVARDVIIVPVRVDNPAHWLSCNATQRIEHGACGCGTELCVHHQHATVSDDCHTVCIVPEPVYRIRRKQVDVAGESLHAKAWCVQSRRTGMAMHVGRMECRAAAPDRRNGDHEKSEPTRMQMGHVFR